MKRYWKLLSFLLTVSFPHLSALSLHTTEGLQFKERKKKKKRNLRLEQRSRSCQNTGGNWKKKTKKNNTGANQSTFGNKAKSLRFDLLISRQVPVSKISGEMPHFQPPRACEFQFRDTDTANHRANTQSARPHYTASERNPRLAQDVMRCLTQLKTRYTQDRQRLDHML